jgi:small ligand-binding sensory domain FIST
MATSSSFELTNPQPHEVASRLQAVASEVGNVAGGLLFLSGGPALQAAEVARAVAGCLDAPVVIACGTGVLTERGEHDNVSTAVGIVWRGGRCRPFWFDAGAEPDGAEVGARVVQEASKALNGSAGAVALFAQPEAFPTTTTRTIRFGPTPRVQLFGGGVSGRPGALVVERGNVHAADVAGLVILGLAPPVVRASVACRLLGELLPVTQVEGGLILRIGQHSAIDQLKQQAANSHGRELLVVAIEVGRDETGRRPRLMVRGIRGIHEARGGLMVSDEVRVGTPVAFAVRDAAASRADLETTLREMAREMAGGIPRFGVYVDCAGRGPEMYGVAGVDVELIRARWPSMPLVGYKSAFELGPAPGGSAIHLYSGVLSVFSSPS